jgi:hypothetical protein
MVKAFVTYRRDDSSEIAHQVYDQLLLAFGSDGVFLDVDTLVPALDFRDQIMAAVEQRRALACGTKRHTERPRE